MEKKARKLSLRGKILINLVIRHVYGKGCDEGGKNGIKPVFPFI